MRSGGGTAGAATLAVLRLRPDGGGWASAGRKTETPWPPRGPRRSLCSSGPPWRLLFFGSDHFAVESLKVLAADRSRSGGAVSSLEVATLSADVPVADFARRERLPLHRWPPRDVEGRFDVGVVVSFGCLLHQRLIAKFPCGILNVHPSLLPRWRGPAPIFHTILNGDTVTGVSVMQIRAHGFDVGPILNQAVHAVPESSTTDELADVLAAEGAQLQLLDTLRKLPRKMADKREQSPAGATFAPKISASMSWIVWEEHTCQHIDRLHRAIGSRFPLRTTWMGGTIKLVDFAGRCHISFAGRLGGLQGGDPEEAPDGGRLLQRLLAPGTEAARRRRRVCQSAGGREGVGWRAASHPPRQKDDGRATSATQVTERGARRLWQHANKSRLPSSA
ncbi:methionyl-tRNA formyltransferase, mitochondrial isoform X4 [Hippocampus comes]|uniref:methionyl-tRNA formyltransferase, mitochondrial isoform X4 n=1 Tax=Hippocampus comes TaxID=109280 RepID=UPI00094E9FE5|nr:PREDICTED: methionyl-tRNA formyltransferase, mitochondrial isoform X4 [Hippocampus comes]